MSESKHSQIDQNTLIAIMSTLKAKRPIFHSEADFQFSLAEEIKQKFPEAEIRLERPFGKELNKYLDILVKIGDSLYPIELKYKTKKLDPATFAVNDERYDLKNQGAADLGAYLFLKDVQRIEELSAYDGFKTGFTIWLTNDKSYWMGPKNTNVNYAPFTLQERAIKTGEIDWNAGRMKGNTIKLREKYQINWQQYSDLGHDIANGDFRYVLLTVKSSSVDLRKENNII